jgi:chemotaxis receptor (MCP) glutamine deamidase CheD
MLQADAALEDVFTKLCTEAEIDATEIGGKRVRAKIFGGADLKTSGDSYSAGQQSIAFVRSWLNTRRISIAAENLGGTRRREIVLLPSRGVVYCRSLALDDDFLIEEKSLLTAESAVTNKVELF